MWRVDTAVPAGSTAAEPDAAARDATVRGTAEPGTARPDEAVRAAQRGDSGAFRVLYRDMQPRLLRYLCALAGDEAEDVASETWLQVSRDLASFTGGYDAFRGWVTTIARHRALDHLRSRGRRPLSVPVPVEELTNRSAADDTAASAIEAVGTDAAIRLIAALPPDQAEAVLLRAVVGLDAKTAGKVIGKRAGAIRSAAHRGLRTLAEWLEQAAESAAGGATTDASKITSKSASKVTSKEVTSKGVTQAEGLTLKDMR